MFDMSQGVCQNEKDLDVFFPDDDGVYNPATLRYAKLVCKGCPIKMECRAEGTRLEIMGVWGGMTEKERRREARAVARKRTQPTEYAKAMAKAANTERSLLAADANIPFYKKILDEQSVGMPMDFIRVLQGRIDNPKLSLMQLGELLGLSKDEVAGKLRRAKAAAISGKKLLWDARRNAKH
jgi:hypothetical protein